MNCAPSRIVALAAIALCVTLAACGNEQDAAAEPAATPTDALRAAVQAYSDAYLTGDAAAYDMLSVRCQQRIPVDQFLAVVSLAKSSYGSALPMRSFTADVASDLARVSYTYDVPALNQTAEPWTREGGQWREDDC